jgi:hypothetical protein
LVNVTNCRWDRSRSAADLQRGDTVHPGESLHLLEGVAEITSSLPDGGRTSVHLEGPMAMIINNEGMPNLLFGRLTGRFTCEHERFALDTPLGRVLITSNASIGVVATANDVELHVFSGTAILEFWAMDLKGFPDQIAVGPGASLRAQVGADGSITVDHGDARENRFVTPAAIAASRLVISDQYVATIRAAHPIAYWRFESDADGVIRNEMSDRFHCRMVGDAVRLRRGHDSRTAEVGFTAGPGYFISDDTLDGQLNDGYSLELWAKPTYFHHGELFSLIQWDTSESPFQRHCFHIELCGPVSGYALMTDMRPVEYHPGRVRLIHRSSECFSKSPYSVRKWQHIAATKDDLTMRLYIDGSLAATCTDARGMPDGLRVLMGQLYPLSPHLPDEVTSRLYVGEMDEVALYSRVLSEDELRSHIRLARPASEVREGDELGAH